MDDRVIRGVSLEIMCSVWRMGLSADLSLVGVSVGNTKKHPPVWVFGCSSSVFNADVKGRRRRQDEVRKVVCAKCANFLNALCFSFALWWPCDHPRLPPPTGSAYYCMLSLLTHTHLVNVECSDDKICVHGQILFPQGKQRRLYIHPSITAKINITLINHLD